MGDACRGGATYLHEGDEVLVVDVIAAEVAELDVEVGVDRLHLCHQAGVVVQVVAADGVVDGERVAEAALKRSLWARV